MLGFSCHRFQHNEWHFTLVELEKLKGYKQNLNDHVWETNTWRHSLNTSRSESFVKKLWYSVDIEAMEYPLLGYFAKFISWIPQIQVYKIHEVHIAIFGSLFQDDFISLLCWIVKFTLLHCQHHVAKSTSAACQHHVAKSTSAACQHHVAKSTSAACQLHFAKLPCPLHHVDCLDGWLLLRMLRRFGGVGAEFRVERGLLKSSFSKKQFQQKCSPNHKAHALHWTCGIDTRA